MFSYTFEFIVGRTVNARRVVQVNADERHTVLADRCADALDWANAKPGRQAAVKGPGLCYEYICLATIDGIARRFAPAPEVKAVTETEWTDPWAGLRAIGVSSDTPSDAQWQLLLEALPAQYEAKVVDNGWHSTNDWDCGCHYAQSHCGDEDYIRLCDKHATDEYRSFFR